ncbi:MAG: hypothetical protein K6E62_08845 [Lachnospiraceae bacterium]|nr:hypothetical protein [Lachnospiraceae bacterium]
MDDTIQKESDIVLNSIKRGFECVCGLERELLYKNKRYFVFLFSRDPEINRYTLYFLPVLRKEKGISTFVIVTPFEELRGMAEDCCKVPFFFYLCSEEESYDICRYFYSFPDPVYKRDICRMVINGAENILSERIMEYVGINGITKKEIVALAVFWFPEVPTDEEVQRACGFEPRVREHIDWGKYAPEETDEAAPFPQNVERGLAPLIRGKIISSGHSIILFSVTRTTRYLINRLSEFNICAVLDNDESLSGTECEGVPVYTPGEYLSGTHQNDIRIILPTRSYRAIAEQLYDFGYRVGEQVFISYVEYKPYHINRIEKEFLRGKTIYEDIRRQYPDERLYFVTYPGIGDTYLAGMYLSDRMKFDGVEKGVVILITETCRRVFSMLDNGTDVKIYTIRDREDGKRLILYMKQIGYDRTNSCNLTHSHDLIDPGYLRGFRGIDFNTMLQKIAFHADRKRPGVEIISQSADEVFEKNGWLQDRTVLLSPYAHSERKLPTEFWAELAVRLKENGFAVCTNVSGDEEAVDGTPPLAIRLEQVFDFVEKAGFFIGLRSGLCDLLSRAKAEKIILYSGEKARESGYTYNFFGLSNMGMADSDTYELTVNSDWKELIEEILYVFKKNRNTLSL